jgi:hypothetical protein
MVPMILPEAKKTTCEAGTQAVLGMGVAQGGRLDCMICRVGEMIRWSFRVTRNEASQRGK